MHVQIKYTFCKLRVYSFLLTPSARHTLFARSCHVFLLASCVYVSCVLRKLLRSKQRFVMSSTQTPEKQTTFCKLRARATCFYASP